MNSSQTNHSHLQAESRDVPDSSSSRLEPRVYVLLLNWRGWEDTIECLESVFRQGYSDYRVIVCDNDSPDDSVARIRGWAAGGQPAGSGDGPLGRLTVPAIGKPIELVEYDRTAAERGGDLNCDAPLVLIHTGGNLGFAGGNNVGIRYALARGDAGFVWLLNNDTVVDGSALSTMVEAAQLDSSVGVVGAKLLYYDQPNVIQVVAGGPLTPWQGMATHVGSGAEDDGSWTRSFDVDFVLGACLLVRAEVVRDIGLLDERFFMYSEELDWCWRARMKGWRAVYAPGSVVWHKVGRSAGQKSPTQEYHSARSTLLFVEKHFPKLLPVAFGYSIYRVLLPKLVRGQPARARAVLQAFRDFFRYRRAQVT